MPVKKQLENGTVKVARTGSIRPGMRKGTLYSSGNLECFKFIPAGVKPIAAGSRIWLQASYPALRIAAGLERPRTLESWFSCSQRFIPDRFFVLKSIAVFIVSVSAAIAPCGGQKPSILTAVGGNLSADEFEQSIRPLLVKYCSDCHEPGNMEGLEFLEAMTGKDLAKLRGVYCAVVEQLENSSMPPPGSSDQPSDAERKTIADWVRKALELKPADTARIDQYVVGAHEDKHGNLWFGTTAKGAARCDGKTLAWFSTADGLPSTVVTCFAEDRNGNLWMGTHEGVCRFDGQSITRFGSAEGQPAAESAEYDPLPAGEGGVQADRDGNIWVNMIPGVFRFDGTGFVEFEVPYIKEETSSYAIFNGRPAMELHDREGNLWFGTDGYGAFRFDGKSFTHFGKEDGLCSNTINSILQDQQGNIWFACMQASRPEMTGDGGVCRFDGKTFTTFPEVKGLSQNDIYTLYETRKGDLWMGATGVGAYRYDGKVFTLFEETDRPHWTRNFGLQAMLEDRRGTLWCGFSGGLFRFNGQSFSNVTVDGPWRPTASQEKQEQELDRILEAPDDWGAEQIPFPLSFAPSIPFNGYEDIRFAPGWSKPESPEFWTYKMVWQIDEDPHLTEERLADLIETYFDGLSRAVAQGGERDPDTLQKPVAVFIQDGIGFRGRLRIYDAFKTKDWICLNARVRGSKRRDQHLVAIEMSPQPFDHEVWSNLEKVRVKDPGNDEASRDE
jgi:Two component regulator propeller